MKYSCSGIVLAGGLSARFAGKNKAFISINGKRILDHIYTVFSSLFAEIILVTNEPLAYLGWDCNIVTDIFPIRSSLTGIHAGLFYSTNPYSFFTACDTPFLKAELIDMIVNNIQPSVDVVIPETHDGLQPLCAIYSKNCIQPVARHLAQHKLQIRQLFRKVCVKTIPEKLLCTKDPDLSSFLNINTLDDLNRAKQISQQQKGDL